MRLTKSIGNTALVLGIFSNSSELISLGEAVISICQRPINLLQKFPSGSFFRSQSCCTFQAFSKTAIFVRAIKSFRWSLL
jgi:hypothetical protein